MIHEHVNVEGKCGNTIIHARVAGGAGEVKVVAS